MYMAKKKSGLSTGKLLGYVVAVLGLVAICMAFLAGVTTGKTKVGSVTVDATEYSGFQVAFGYKKNDVAVLGFSFMALLPLLLAVAGTVLAVVNTLKKDSKLLNFVVAGLFVVAGILYFIMPSFMVFADTLSGASAKLLDFKLGVGAILAGICSLLAGLIALAKPFMKK